MYCEVYKSLKKDFQTIENEKIDAFSRFIIFLKQNFKTN